jgi:Ser/Thr protein kinase RdoA (MazF antagonist)
MVQHSNVIPSEILEAYYSNGIAHCSPIPGGEVNITLLVTDNNGERTILQQLNTIYDTSMAEDYEAVSAHLRKSGWEMATALKAHDGTTYISDSTEQLWRAFRYIESTPGRDLEGELSAITALGGLVGALHHSLATLDYEPKFGRPHSHDANYQAEQLAELLPKITNPGHRMLAEEMIALSREDAIDTQPTQLIHGDTRIGNTLVRQDTPFTFVDWDGLKRANPLTDVGDMLQSTVGEIIMKGKSCSVIQLHPMLLAYYEKAELHTDKQAFIDNSLAAARSIAVNLGMRHLIDSVEDRYFVWGTTRFKSRFEFNVFCAQRQRQVYAILKA